MSRFRLYSYDCKNCNEKFEWTVDSQVAEAPRCQVCDSTNVQRAINATAGYTGDCGSASVRPRNVFKRSKS